MNSDKSVSITVLLPAGRLPLEVMETVYKLADKYGFGIYLSTAQNLRLINVPEVHGDTVREALKDLGMDLKGPGKFPLPRVCIGKGHCNLGINDTEDLSRRILERFKGKEKTKAKFKIAVAGCPAACTNPKTTDFGIISTRKGFDLYVGGKGGFNPKTGIRIAKGVDFESILDHIEKLVEFHDRKTETKQRMNKLLNDPEFPFSEV